jgi:hypothetical protein
MHKLIIAAILVLGLGTVAHADSFTLTASQQGAIISAASGDISSHLMAYLLSPGAQTEYADGLADFLTAESYQAQYSILAGLGGPFTSTALQDLSLADSYYAEAQTDFNTFARDIGASSFAFVPAPESGVLGMLALGLGALFLLRRFKPSVAVKSAA